MRLPLLSRIFIFLAAAFFVVSLFLRVLFTSWDETGLYCLFASLVFLLLSVVFDWEGYLNFFSLARTRRGIKTTVGMILLAVVLGGINYASTFIPGKLDLSPIKSHTLTDYSKKIAKTFKDDIEFVYLGIPEGESREMDNQIRLAVRRYQDENPHVKFTRWDLSRHPEMSKLYQLNAQEQALFAVHKDRRERFYQTDENSMTQALLRLLKGRKTIYFSIGHGESSLENTNPRGISHLKKEVERLFYDIQEINLETEVLPDAATALVILGPEKKFSPKVADKIFDYFQKGGQVFLAFDPIQNADDGKFLLRVNAEMSKGMVHQEENAMANVGPQIVSGNVSEEPHFVTKSIGKDAPVLFYVTGALSFIKPSEFTVHPLLVSAKSTVLRDGFTKNDKEIGRGSYVLFADIENDKGGHMLVSADSDIFANQYLYQHMNPTFMFHVFSFLSKDEDVVKDPPKNSPSQDFKVTDTTFKLYIGLFAFPLPILFLSWGGFIWFRRRWL